MGGGFKGGVNGVNDTIPNLSVCSGVLQEWRSEEVDAMTDDLYLIVRVRGGLKERWSGVDGELSATVLQMKGWRKKIARQGSEIQSLVPVVSGRAEDNGEVLHESGQWASIQQT